MRLSRRDLLAAAASLGAGAAVSRLAPGDGRLFAQVPRPTVAPGKESLLVRSLRPPDYETPVALLDSWITPVEHFYVRSHLPVPPSLDLAAWTLQVEGEVATPLALSVEDIRRMPVTTITATLECAGNGRAFFDPPVAGVQWGKGAVGTARWTGVRMADVLKRAGVRATGKFVVMNGADRALGTMQDFMRQLPIEKATHADTLIAYEMNGEPLPPVHGFPLRAIVPGWEGAYAMKWLTTLRVVNREFDGFWVTTGYRYPLKQVAPGAAVDPKDMAPLTGLVVKSLITKPTDGAILAPGKVDVAGFAWAGETAISRVDVSSDNGATWQAARLTGENARYTWRRFEAQVNAPRPESLLIMSRAADANGRTQPISPPWNPSGYLWNAPDSVRVELK
jgi:DMSO/TMAO reductase YedYZ molybdopterin-dependent catalytic subunit